jgi:peptide/nickel transport system ATP-binding protein
MGGTAGVMAEDARAAAEDAPVLSVVGLRAYYRVRAYGVEREVRAVDDVTLHVGRNEVYGLAGESSSGKTTLIKVIAGAIRPPLSVVGGSVVFDFGGRRIDVTGADRGALEDVRWSHLACVMQGSMNVLNPLRRIRRTFVDFAFRHVGKPMAEFMQIVRLHLRRLNLDASVLDAYPHQLSGGMRQRVTIALATICWPRFIIADEPTTALDVVVQKSVLAMIRDAQRQCGSSMIFVTHDLAVHANVSHRLGIMYAGRLVEEGVTADVFRAPRHPYTRHLIASVPRIGATMPRQSLEGSPPNLADPPHGCRFHPRCPLAMDICRREAPPMTTVGTHRVACFAAGEGAAL